MITLIHTYTNDAYIQILDECQVKQELGTNKMAKRINLEN